jgi:hypothetical protein
VPRDVRAVAEVFPAIRDRLAAGDAHARVGAVRDLTMIETVLAGAGIQLGPHTTAECALILWHEASHGDLTAVAAEFSYRYGDKHEDYLGARTERAYEVFRSLQTDLPAWVDPALPTKTAFVYGAAVET